MSVATDVPLSEHLAMRRHELLHGGVDGARLGVPAASPTRTSCHIATEHGELADGAARHLRGGVRVHRAGPLGQARPQAGGHRVLADRRHLPARRAQLQRARRCCWRCSSSWAGRRAACSPSSWRRFRRKRFRRSTSRPRSGSSWALARSSAARSGPTLAGYFADIYGRTRRCTWPSSAPGAAAIALGLKETAPVKVGARNSRRPDAAQSGKARLGRSRLRPNLTFPPLSGRKVF